MVVGVAVVVVGHECELRVLNANGVSDAGSACVDGVSDAGARETEVLLDSFVAGGHDVLSWCLQTVQRT